jgi:phosphohistidine swiveling domain-containing protein
MTHPFILPLRRCIVPSLVGGKAVGLARLMAAGMAVPDGFCVTAEAYHQALRAIGFSSAERWKRAIAQTDEARREVLNESRSIILKTDVSLLASLCVEEIHRIADRQERRWAVRSSATNEDGWEASFAGLYRTELAISPTEFGQAIKNIWASIWDERVVAYVVKSGTTGSPPAMAVVIQPMLDAQVAGVAYSIHPVTGHANQVTINVVRGLAVPLVEGLVAPDQYVVELGENDQSGYIRRRILAQQPEQLVMGAGGLCKKPLSVAEREQPALSEQQLLGVARLAKRIEHIVQYPVDMEWAFEGEGLWVLQARPIAAVKPSSELTDDECEWSRTNFKETMPEVPSPMGRSFLESFMEGYILSHYRRLGCRIPQGLSSVRTLHGRPYLNVSLFHSLVGQLRGEPLFNVEQMGGEPLRTAPAVTALGWFALIRAGWLMWREMGRVTKSGPRWFAEMKKLADSYRRDCIEHFSIEELTASLDELGLWLDRREVTFGIAAGVGQCLQTFSILLPRWLGDDWRSLLNAALQGQGTVISAQQIIRLAELVEMARADEAVSRELLRERSIFSSFRQTMRGRPFLDAFDRYLEDYGHRGLSESDVMSPRFADKPEVLLAVITVQLRGPAETQADIAERQRSIREKALTTIRARCGWRLDRWAIFQWWYRRLCRFYALREANRHHLMYYSTAARNLLLRFGEWLAERGVLTARDDVFFLTWGERMELSSGISKDWAALVQARRVERECWMKIQVPDTIRDWEEVTKGHQESVLPGPEGVWRGIPISLGCVAGPVRVVRSMEDWPKVKKGDILFVPVIDPGMAPLFGIVAGLVVEMGGTLSHGAIIAREYGLPAVVNVGKVTEQLRDGDRIRLDAGAGEIRLDSDAESEIFVKLNTTE